MPTEGLHGGTDLSRCGRPRHCPGDGARPRCDFLRRGCWQAGRRVQDNGRALRAVRGQARAGLSDLRAGNSRRGDRLGSANIVRPGRDATILALALMVPRAHEAAARLKAEHGIDCEVVDVRSLVPLDTRTILDSVGRTHRLFTVEENPRLCGWGAEIVSIVADEAFYDLDGPPVRITTPHIPLPAADILEDIALPTVDRIVDRVRRSMQA